MGHPLRGSFLAAGKQKVRLAALKLLAGAALFARMRAVVVFVAIVSRVLLMNQFSMGRCDADSVSSYCTCS